MPRFRISFLPTLLAIGLFSSSVLADDAPAAPPPPAPATDALAPLHKMTLRECVDTALLRNPDVQTSAEETEIAEAHRKGTRGELGPKVHADASIQEWNEPYDLPFGGVSFNVHKQTVWNLTVTVTQPISGLFALYDAYKIRELGVDVAQIRHQVVRREAAFRVTERYYHLLQAEKLSEVAVASVDQLTAQLRQSTSFHENGIVSLDDVLRAKLALANAQQRVIQMRARVTVERAHLASLMGIPAGSAIDVMPRNTESPPKRDDLSLEQAETRGESSRPELVEIDKRIEASTHDVRVAYMKLAPQVNLVGAYIHNEGSPFNPDNSAYVGGTASWDVWDWGTTYSGVAVAKSRGRQAALARAKIDDQIRLDVREAFVNAGSAAEAMTVARASVESAEENFRLVRKRYEANAATSFDVVDAESLLTQARGQLQTALYDLLISRASLKRAMGESPVAMTED